MTEVNKEIKEDEFDYWCCPECGWDTCSHDGQLDSTLTQISDQNYRYDGGRDWVEHWCCPECGEKFEVSNGT